MIYIVTRYDNYGYDQSHSPERKAFTSRQAVIDGIKKAIKGDWDDEDWDEKDLEENLSIYNKGRHWGDYRFETEEISTTDWE